MKAPGSILARAAAAGGALALAALALEGSGCAAKEASGAVGSTEDLQRALRSAHAGQVIELEPGAYPLVTIEGLDAGGPVTIRSRDPSRPAVLAGLKIFQSSGLVFEHLEFSFESAATNKETSAFGVKVEGSKDVHFRNDNVHGTLDHDATLDIGGIWFKQCSNISLENSELQQLHVGVVAGRSDNVSITGNNFHDIRVDGVDSTASTHVLVSGNNFSSFHHAGDARGGDHSDAIQFFTGRQQVGASDITVTDNVIVQGEGRVMQGVFLNDKSKMLPFHNVKISRNIVVGGNWNAISVNHAQGVEISDNVVEALSSQNQQPSIRVGNSEDVVVSGNHAKNFMIGNNNSRLKDTANKSSGVAVDNGYATLTRWLGEHPRQILLGPRTAAELIGHPTKETAAPIYAPGSPDQPDQGKGERFHRGRHRQAESSDQ